MTEEQRPEFASAHSGSGLGASSFLGVVAPMKIIRLMLFLKVLMNAKIPSSQLALEKRAGRSSRKKVLWVAGVVIALYVLSLFVPIISPYTRYPLYLVKCGGQPIVATNFSAAYSYDVPGSKYYGVDPFTSDYFCSEAEAQAAGYHKNVLND